MTDSLFDGENSIFIGQFSEIVPYKMSNKYRDISLQYAPKLFVLFIFLSIFSQCSIAQTCFGKLATSPLVCSGRGNCIAKDSCVGCGGGFGGPECNLPGCYAAPVWNGTIISSFGLNYVNTISPYSLERRNWFGTKCKCFLHPFTNPWNFQFSKNCSNCCGCFPLHAFVSKWIGCCLWIQFRKETWFSQ
jgi:hypothetical protein